MQLSNLRAAGRAPRAPSSRHKASATTLSTAAALLTATRQLPCRITSSVCVAAREP
jgi:hypothetical protein